MVFIIILSIIGMMIASGMVGWTWKKKWDEEQLYRREVRKMERMARHRIKETNKYRDMIWDEAQKLMEAKKNQEV